MKIVHRIALLLLFASPALPVPAQAVVPMSLQLLEGNHVVLDDVGMYLLYLAKTGQRTDLVALAQSAGNTASPATGEALRRLLSTSDARERFQRQTVLDYTMTERVNGIRNGWSYLVPLAATLGSYDARRKQIALSLRLSASAGDADPERRCAPLQMVGTQAVRVCVTTDSLRSSDPIFTAVPADTEQVAQALRARYAQGQLQLYAAALDADQPVTSTTSPAQSQWSQPVRITGLLLVDSGTAQVIAAAKAQGGVMPAPPPSVGAIATAESVSRPTKSSPDTAPSPAPSTPSTPHPGPMTGATKGPGTVEPGTPDTPTGPAASVPDVDRLLALLSYAVYGTDERRSLVQHKLDELDAKISRIEADQGLNPGIKTKELASLASKVSSLQRKATEIDGMLGLKAGAAAAGDAIPVPVDSASKTNKVYYEHYRLRDGRHVVVFRGTDNRDDIETDIDLATSPDTLNEIASHMGTGDSPVYDKVADLLRNQAAGEVATAPAAFYVADTVVGSLIRAGLKPSSMIVTGHSLGGSLAQYAGLRNHVGTVVTFNPAPLNAGLIAKLPSTAVVSQEGPRNYIAFVPPSRLGAQGTPDPVSRGLANLNGVAGMAGMEEAATLRLLGRAQVVNVCSDLAGDDYAAFRNTVQSWITKKTVSTMARGSSQAVKVAGVVGATGAAASASTDQVSAALNGRAASRDTAKKIAAGVNCYRHPFACASVAAGGGLVSVMADAKLPHYWAIYQAHRMKNLYEALNDAAPPTCALANPGFVALP